MFKRKEKEIKDVNAMMRNEMYWSQYRQEELTKSETRMGSFVDDLTKIKGFKYIIFVLKALIENFVETSTPDSKVDIGPINTIISSNYIDGLRLRGSLQTTAKLHPHLFSRDIMHTDSRTRSRSIWERWNIPSIKRNICPGNTRRTH